MTDLIHTPSGLEHPYEQLPEERFPRQPLADQPFKIGLVTRPPGAVKGVIVFAQLGDGPPQRHTAVHRPAWRPELEEGVGAEFLDREVRIDQDVWEAELVAPPFGQTLTYWAETEDGGSRTPNFTLAGEAWVTGGGCTIDGQGDMLVSQAVGGIEQLAGLPSLLGVEWLTDGRKARRVRLSFACAANERFFGLGERFNALDQRGNVLDIRCYEQYKSQGKRTYMPIPFLLSSQGYGVWVQSSRWMQFDLAAGQADRWALEADLGDDAALSLAWFQDDDPFEIVGQFTRRTGPAALPPAWVFGLWMSSNEWNSQARIRQEVETSFEHGIVPGVVVIEAWSDEATFYIWNDAEYTPKPGQATFRYDDFTFPADGKWPDPKGMVDWLHAQNIRILLWQIPALKAAEGVHPQHDNDRDHFLKSGFAVADPDGTPHAIRPFWFRGGEIWDVTNPAARAWWLNKRAYLLDDMGIDGFKTDGGEHLWSEEVRFADGRRGDEVWNEYAQLYSQAYFDFANRNQPAGEGPQAITFSRAGFTGSQRSPLHWAGDENSTWDAYRHSILAGLSAGLSGIPFWTWDFGGFSGEIPSAELYLRATAMAAFCPVMQYHAEFNAHRTPSRDRTPWNIQARTGDERVLPVFRFFVNVRHNLLPYLWQEAQHAAATGQPMMRSLQLLAPEASTYAYFLGRDLLVVPVVEPGATEWPVYLPVGRWVNLWDGELLDGGRTLTVKTPIDHIPVFVRHGAQIPVHLAPSGRLGDGVTPTVEPNQMLAWG